MDNSTVMHNATIQNVSIINNASTHNGTYPWTIDRGNMTVSVSGTTVEIPRYLPGPQVIEMTTCPVKDRWKEQRNASTTVCLAGAQDLAYSCCSELGGSVRLSCQALWCVRDGPHVFDDSWSSCIQRSAESQNISNTDYLCDGPSENNGARTAVTSKVTLALLLLLGSAFVIG